MNVSMRWQKTCFLKENKMHPNILKSFDREGLLTVECMRYKCHAPVKKREYELEKIGELFKDLDYDGN